MFIFFNICSEENLHTSAEAKTFFLDQTMVSQCKEKQTSVNRNIEIKFMNREK